MLTDVHFTEIHETYYTNTRIDIVRSDHFNCHTLQVLVLRGLHSTSRLCYVFHHIIYHYHLLCPCFEVYRGHEECTHAQLIL